MCLALPGKVVEVDAEKHAGRVDVFGTARVVNLGLLDDVSPGDWVLIQVGFAVERIDEAQAQETVRLIEEMGRAFEAELAAVEGQT